MAILTLFGAYVAYVTIQPKITLTPIPSVNSLDQNLLSFTVKNDGYIGVRHIRLNCFLAAAVAAEKYLPKGSTYQIKDLTGADDTSGLREIDALPKDASATRTCPKALYMANAHTAAGSSAEIHLYFRSALLPFFESYRFVSIQQGAALAWVAAPPILGKEADSQKPGIKGEMISATPDIPSANLDFFMKHALEPPNANTQKTPRPEPGR